MLGNTKFLIIVAVILVIVAAGLGIAIIRSSTRVTSSFAPEPTSESVPNPQTSTELTGDEKRILEIPDGSNPEALAAYGDLISQAAIEASEIKLIDCNTSPLAVKGKLSSIVKFINESDKEAQIAFDADHLYAVPASGQINVTLDFGKGVGIYGYSCNGSTKPVGVIYITS